MISATLKKVGIYNFLPITHKRLLDNGYIYYGDYYCAPSPADGSTYQLEYKSTHFESKGDGKGLLPVAGSEEWRAYLPFDRMPTIRRFKTMGELNYFHKGMCGSWLY